MNHRWIKRSHNYSKASSCFSPLAKRFRSLIRIGQTNGLHARPDAQARRSPCLDRFIWQRRWSSNHRAEQWSISPGTSRSSLSFLRLVFAFLRFPIRPPLQIAFRANAKAWANLSLFFLYGRFFNRIANFLLENCSFLWKLVISFESKLNFHDTKILFPQNLYLPLEDLSKSLVEFFGNGEKFLENALESTLKIMLKKSKRQAR